jgi:hypothetical protein
MRLREWDWAHQQYVTVDYPDDIVARFVDWLRTTSAWKENPEIVYRRFVRLNHELAATRLPRPAALAPVDPGPEERRAQQLATLARGRETARRNREAAKATGG